MPGSVGGQENAGNHRTGRSAGGYSGSYVFAAWFLYCGRLAGP
jgi:hypothetical protein